MQVTLASLKHLDEVSRLFEQYRVFYNQSSDLDAATKFLQERFQNQDSTVFIASECDRVVGFIQLYPSFSSVSMKRVWILNDLFVDESYRKQGIAKLLMSAAEQFARETGAVRLALSTQISNVAAQALYESLGYIKDKDFDHYALNTLA
jgi:ribosomal protein S18 acetylase RimI-like enzyme